MDGGAWKAAVHGVAEGRTRLSDFTFNFHFHALEKEMATHSSVLAWRIPGTGGAWWAAIYGVAQSRTRRKEPETPDPVLLAGLGGKHQDRRSGRAPDLGGDRFTGDVGEPEVEHDQVGLR